MPVRVRSPAPFLIYGVIFVFPLYDTIPSRKRPYVLYALIILNAAIFLYELSLNDHQLLKLLYFYGLLPARYTVQRIREEMGFSLIPWITHMFLHGGWAHILGNMWFLWIFGDNVEDVMGHWKFAAFYITGGIFAALLNFLFMPFSQVPMIGASGAISAVMGAYFILFPHSRIVSLVFFFFFFTIIEIPALVYLFFWFLMQVFNGMINTFLPVSNVAWWAHAGGFLYGLLAAKHFRNKYYAYWMRKGSYTYWW